MFTVMIILFYVTAIASATHDIAADGYYMLALKEEQQTFFVGIRIIHHRFVLIISTKGLQKGFITQGRYSRLVYNDIVSFGTPIFANIITEILLTIKYGIPSAK